MKKSLVCALGSGALSLLVLSYAGAASATPFGGNNGRSSDSRGRAGLGNNISLFSSVGFSGQTGPGASFGRVDFVWTNDPVESHPSDDRADRAREVLANLREHLGRSEGYGSPADGQWTNPRNGSVPAIPEPSAALIFGAGLLVAGWRRRN